MPDKMIEYDNVIIAVTAFGEPVLVDAPQEMVSMFDGPFFEDNAISSIKKYPTIPGVYRCKIRYEFYQGYFEGWKADGESDWDFAPLEVVKLDLPHTSPNGDGGQEGG